MEVAKPGAPRPTSLKSHNFSQLYADDAIRSIGTARALRLLANFTFVVIAVRFTKESPMTTFLITAVVAACVACGSPSGQRTALSAQTASTQLPTGTLDELLAPIALYPDALLAQILMSAQDAPKVAELDKWLKANSTLKGTQLQDAAVKAGFDASYVALALFPSVVARMSEQIAWTVVLGQQFTKDKTAVFAAIQKLRKQAQTVGTLKSNAQQEVGTKVTSSGEQVIVIEPTNPQIIYVPQYNTQVVYTQPPPTQTTVIVQEEDNDAEVAVAAGLIGFTAGIAIGAAMDNNYYYGPYGWHGGAYMYNDAWDDYYDHREDAREDWIDHREDLSEERTDRRENTQEQRTDRQENRQENRPEATSEQRAQAQQKAQERRESGTTAQSQSAQRQANRQGSAEARGYSSGASTQSATQRSSGGTRSDAFSGYSSGSSQRASSSRGQASRSRSGGGASRGGGRRR
jgi:uncharacterized membrane protein YgcG